MKRSLVIAILANLISVQMGDGAQVLLGMDESNSDPYDSALTDRQTTVKRIRELQTLNERRFQEIAVTQSAQMTSLASAAIVGLAIAPSINTLSSTPVDGQEAASYNQWLGSSIVSSPTAASMQVTGISLRLNAVVRNSNTFIGITESTNNRPDMERIVARMNTEVLSTMDLNTVMAVDLVPEAGSDPGILLHDREYWVVFGVDGLDHSEASSTGLYHWSYTESTGPFETTPDWSVGTRTATANTLGQNWTPIVQSPQSFSVTLSPIPEPTSGVLFLTALTTIALQRRRLS